VLHDRTCIIRVFCFSRKVSNNRYRPCRGLCYHSNSAADGSISGDRSQDTITHYYYYYYFVLCVYYVVLKPRSLVEADRLDCVAPQLVVLGVVPAVVAMVLRVYFPQCCNRADSGLLVGRWLPGRDTAVVLAVIHYPFIPSHVKQYLQQVSRVAEGVRLR